MALNVDNIVGLLEPAPEHVLLDLGCDDGAQTMRFAAAIGAEHVHGGESALMRRSARRRSIRAGRRCVLRARARWPTD